MAKRIRLDPDTRRAQLVELGVRMLATRRLDDLSVEALAEQAGISRGLLFHYFRSKQEFHLEVVRAAARELLERTAPDADLAPLEQLTTSLAAFIDYVTENRDAYVSLVRGAASGDATVRRVSDETRTELANRVLKHLDALGLPADTRTEEHTSELQSRRDLVCRLLLEKKKKIKKKKKQKKKKKKKKKKK